MYLVVACNLHSTSLISRSPFTIGLADTRDTYRFHIIVICGTKYFPSGYVRFLDKNDMFPDISAIVHMCNLPHM